ncbi:MAG: hypothetical protein JSW25_02235 [Thermoplasmata archaeon]|nr:MAG: hypothetical protein JSW25_02235 [Thermoplasmata archaeon]
MVPGEYMKGYSVSITQDCTAKQQLGVNGLAEKVFNAKEVEAMAAEWAQKDPNRTAEQIFIKTTWKDRDGNEREREISLSEARMQFYDLQSYLGTCATCGANVASDRFKGGVYSGFGCYLHIGHPISKDLEDALMAGAQRAVANSKIEPSIAFMDRIAKAKVSGQVIADLRKESPPGIESKQPQSISWGGFLGKKTINSDMLLEMFLSGEATPEDALLFHHFAENIHTALQTTGGSYEMKEFITTLSALYGTAADMKKTIKVYKG